jgi:hypothetical protein
VLKVCVAPTMDACESVSNSSKKLGTLSFFALNPAVVQKCLVGAARIFLAPDQRLPNQFVLIRPSEMPQESLGALLVKSAADLLITKESRLRCLCCHEL